MKGGKVMGMKEFLGLLAGICYCYLMCMIFSTFIDETDWYFQIFYGIFIPITSFSGVYLAESFATLLYNIEDKRKRG